MCPKGRAATSILDNSERKFSMTVVRLITECECQLHDAAQSPEIAGENKSFGADDGREVNSDVMKY